MVLLIWKDELKSVLMRLGVQSVTIFGLLMMEMWPASNLASHKLVCYSLCITKLLINYIKMVSRCSNLL